MKTYDVVVVGASLLGINCAYRLQTETMETTFTVLVGGRNSMVPGTFSSSRECVRPADPLKPRSGSSWWLRSANEDTSKPASLVLGSGATAVALLPRLAEQAAEMTIVQHSPTYVGAEPDATPLSSWARKLFPLSWVAVWECLYHITTCYLLIAFCRAFLQTAEDAILKATAAVLPGDIKMKPHFGPTYMPWTQRLCLAPDGDFFKAFHRKNTHVVTGEIDKVTERGIRMKSGGPVDADAIITATGIKMKPGGGVELRVDGKAVSWAKRLG